MSLCTAFSFPEVQLTFIECQNRRGLFITPIKTGVSSFKNTLDVDLGGSPLGGKVDVSPLADSVSTRGSGTFR
ncbi:hypothetical protein ALTERO38_90229 [Alteromonas sp. 38]|nr:hypothetical protein ALTER154_10219 [Alteromonas sp. 154]VXC52259.1 hypothetical protein ALTERO38_90229 [Alteromonas sp. 38]